MLNKNIKDSIIIKVSQSWLTKNKNNTLLGTLCKFFSSFQQLFSPLLSCLVCVRYWTLELYQPLTQINGQEKLVPVNRSKAECPLFAQVPLPDHRQHAGTINQHPVAPGRIQVRSSVQAVAVDPPIRHKREQELHAFRSSGSEEDKKEAV